MGRRGAGGGKAKFANTPPRIRNRISENGYIKGHSPVLDELLLMWTAARLLPLFWNNRLSTDVAFGGRSFKTAAASVPQSTGLLLQRRSSNHTDVRP
jgi:hypothetical protein